jgi:DNA-binding response OmpR family regulator
MPFNQTKPTIEKPTQPPTATILLVEDNPNVAELICLLLQESGFETRHATTVGQGLLLAVTQPPALIVLDVDLPDGNGFDLCRRLKANPTTASVPVIFCTGRADSRAEALAVGGVDCVHKPGDVFELPVRIQRALDHHASSLGPKSNIVSNVVRRSESL